ncbi:hypothetical protein LCGC14_1997120, partial [marine sediment metagenome]
MPEAPDEDICRCVNAFSTAFKRGNPPLKKGIKTLIGLLAPVLIGSPDPRIKALGLALQASSLIF